jgi:hypothetical protein
MLLGEQLDSKPSAWGSNPHPGATSSAQRGPGSLALSITATSCIVRDFRRARQVVSQHIAKVPSARARLVQFPCSPPKFQKVWVSGGYGWPRLPVEQHTPSEYPGSNPGTPTKRGERTELRAATELVAEIFSCQITGQ